MHKALSLVIRKESSGCQKDNDTYLVLVVRHVIKRCVVDSDGALADVGACLVDDIRGCRLPAPHHKVGFHEVRDSGGCQSAGELRGNEGELVGDYADDPMDLPSERTELAIAAMLGFGEPFFRDLTAISRKAEASGPRCCSLHPA